MTIRTIVMTSALLCSTAFYAVSSAAASFTRSGNFITVKVQQPSANAPRLVRLQVVGDKIIRVEATAKDAFPTKQSLIIVPQPTDQNFQISEDTRRVIVKTPFLSATVDKATGRVIFIDKNGRQILAEDEKQGKSLIPYTVPAREIGVDIAKVPESQRHGYTWRLLFDDAGDNGLYGLGQHQANELNMKGKNEDLYQYNTKVSVPFVISNKNYGILWDSYSYCRFGNPDDYQQLHRAFKLFDVNGKEGHLTGTYTDKTGRTITRDEDSIYFEYLLPAIPLRKSGDLGEAALPKGFKLNGAHVTYEGYIQAPTDNLYRFLLYYAGYMTGQRLSPNIGDRHGIRTAASLKPH